MMVCAHCTCMASLGETCTHIAAFLFYLDAVAHLQGMKTIECSWIISSYLRSAQYLPIKNINYTSARGLKRKLDGTINNPESVSNESAVHTATGQVESTSEELDQLDLDLFFQGISK